MLNGDGQQYPIVYFDDFWLLRDKLMPMNETVEEVPLHMTIKSQKFWWMQIQQQVSRIECQPACVTTTYQALAVSYHASMWLSITMLSELVAQGHQSTYQRAVYVCCALLADGAVLRHADQHGACTRW